MADATGSAVGLASSLATGNPIGAGLAIVGLGMQLFGGFGQAQNAKQVAAVSGDIARNEQVENDIKKQQMDTEARRQQ